MILTCRYKTAVINLDLHSKGYVAQTQCWHGVGALSQEIRGWRGIEDALYLDSLYETVIYRHPSVIVYRSLLLIRVRISTTHKYLERVL